MANKAFQKTANAFRALDSKARNLELGELHISSPAGALLGNHSFTGPGNRLDLPKVRNFKPVNAIDDVSRSHDFAYERANKLSGEARRKAIRRADELAIKAYDRFKNVGGYTLARSGIAAKIFLEDSNPELARKILGNLSSV